MRVKPVQTVKRKVVVERRDGRERDLVQPARGADGGSLGSRLPRAPAVIVLPAKQPPRPTACHRLAASRRRPL